MNILAGIGRAFIAFVTQTGRLALFTFSALVACVRPPIYWYLIGQQMLRIGYFSLPVVGLTAFFTAAHWHCKSISAATASAPRRWCLTSSCSASHASSAR